MPVRACKNLHVQCGRNLICHVFKRTQGTFEADVCLAWFVPLCPYCFHKNCMASGGTPIRVNPGGGSLRLRRTLTNGDGENIIQFQCIFIEGAVTIGEQTWHKRFLIIWSGQGISIFTSSVIQMAIIWFVTGETGSAAVLSFLTLIGFLPQAVLGTFIGALIDRYNRKLIMIASDLFIALSSLTLVAAALVGEIPIWLIAAVLFVRSVGTAFHAPSLQAVTPLIVPKDQLTRCAGYARSFESVSMILSPAVAAMLYGVWDLSTVILLDVFGALFAVFTLCLVKIPATPKTSQVHHTPNLLRETRDGFRILRNEPGLLGLMLVSALYAIIYFPIGTLYPLMVVSYFGGSFAQWGVVEVIFSVGMLLGSLCLGLWGGKVKKITAIALSIFIYGLGLCISGLLPADKLIFFAVLSFFMGIASPIFGGIETAIFQTKIHPDYLGRVLSLSSSISMIAMPVGLVLSGAFAELIGVEKWFLLLGVFTVLLALFSVLLPSIRKCCD